MKPAKVCEKQQKKAQAMTESLEKLLAAAQSVTMTEPQKNEQRVSFAYGTTFIENENVTRAMVEAAVQVENSKRING